MKNMRGSIAVVLTVCVVACGQESGLPRPSTTLTRLSCAEGQTYQSDIIGGSRGTVDEIHVTFNRKPTPETAEAALRECLAAAQRQFSMRNTLLTVWAGEDQMVALPDGSEHLVFEDGAVKTWKQREAQKGGRGK